MKKFLLIVLVMMTFVLTACGNQKKEYLGLWKYTLSSLDYTVNLLEDGKWEMTQGTASRNGTYTVSEEGNAIIIALNYGNTYGYMKYENKVMCAYDYSTKKCEFEFERG